MILTQHFIPMISESSTNDSVSARQTRLFQWANEQIAQIENNSNPSNKAITDADMLWQPVGSDAGFRKYYRRATSQGSVVAVDAPVEMEDTVSFVHIAQQWRAGDIYVPKVLAVDYQQGFMLQEDLGDTQLQTVLNEETASECYSRALDMLLPIQQQSAEQLPPFDETLLRFELSLFPQWFLQQLLGIDIDDQSIATLLASVTDLLADTIAEQPYTTMHRDYHSRNIMVANDNELALIDFQGALHGPILYDAASLLKDCYISWSEPQVQQWLKAFAQNHPILKPYEFSTIQRWFDFTAMQRHLKCLGIFSRLWLRDGKSAYLADLPRTFHYVVSTCQRYSELQTFGQWLEISIEALMQQRLQVIVAEVA